MMRFSTDPRCMTQLSASSVGASPGLAIRPRLGDQPVQLAGIDIGLDLAVPLLGVELGKPGPKCGSLCGRQLLDRLLDLFDGVHSENMAWQPARSNVSATA